LYYNSNKLNPVIETGVLWSLSLKWRV